MELALDERACLVTGGTAGIGLAVAVRLALAGARVAVCGRDEQRLAAAREALAAAGAADVLALRADLASPGEPERVVEEAAGRFGGLDVLVNNVGAARIRRWDELDDDGWNAAFQLNLMS